MLHHPKGMLNASSCSIALAIEGAVRAIEFFTALRFAINAPGDTFGLITCLSNDSGAA